MNEPIYHGVGGLTQALNNGRRLVGPDPAAAAAQAREILRSNPLQPDALRLLGVALRRLGRIQEAEAAELDAIKASAHHPILAQAASALATERLDVAERLIRPYLKEAPDDVAAIGMLAEIANRVGVYPEAEKLLRRALELAPAFIEARLSLARLLFKQDRADESLAALEEVLRKDPRNVKALRAKAATLSETGDYDGAIAVHQELLTADAQSPMNWLTYGHVLKTLGRIDEGVAAYRKALTLDPACGEAWWSLANLKTMRFAESDLDAMNAALAADRLGLVNQLHIHFAIGKALEDSRSFEESFRHYQAGNRLRRSMTPYDPALITEEVTRSERVFTSAFLSDLTDQGCLDPDPIFVLGMPRAGSTLIEQILSSHSQVEGTSELPYIPALARQLLAERWKSPETSYPGVLAELAPGELRALGEAYLRRARVHRKTGRPFFIDKLPNNWSDIGFIHLILPNARVIDARRHPLACCFSNYKQLFARGQAFSYSLEDVGRYYSDYVRLLCHFDKVLPGKVHRIFHEDLVRDPNQQVRSLLAFLALPYEPGCLRFHENARAVRTASSEQVRRPINREGFDQWRAYEPWLEPLKRALGPVLDLYPAAPPA